MSTDIVVNVANAFELTASKETSISYFATTDGKPHSLNYKTQSIERNFNSSEIQKLETDFATLLTVIIDKPNPEFGGNKVTLTLVLPSVILPIGVKEEPVKTEAILTTQKTVGQLHQPLGAGQIQTYEVLSLKGTAKFVGL